MYKHISYIYNVGVLRSGFIHLAYKLNSYLYSPGCKFNMLNVFRINSHVLELILLMIHKVCTCQIKENTFVAIKCEQEAAQNAIVSMSKKPIVHTMVQVWVASRLVWLLQIG